MKEKLEYPIKLFKAKQDFEKWLEKNGTKVPGIWLRFFKKDSGKKSITYAEAVNEAFSFGWIDGQAQKYDEHSWLQKFTPRRAKSIWSKRNTEYVQQLIEAGRIRPEGLQQVSAAKADGRWDKAYASPINSEVPEDFIKQVSKNKKAFAFFESLNKTNKYAIAHRLSTASKPETRKNRMKKFLQMMREGKKFY